MKFLMQNDPQGRKDVIAVGKGQLISNRNVSLVSSILQKKKSEKNLTSSRIFFCLFLGELDTPK